MPDPTRWRPSRELLQALKDADLIPDCARCRKAVGLCAAHRREILPQLAKPTLWLRLIGKMHGAKEQPVDRAHAARYHTKSERRMAALVRAVEGNARSRRIA